MMDKITSAAVESFNPLTDSIVQLILAPEQYISYKAGQYLQILCGEEAFSYSIANAPLGTHKYELHIRHSLDNPYNQLLFAQIKKQGHVRVRLPYGECTIEHLDKNKPILFLAGGTGFAPIKAMIEQLLTLSDPRPFELIWGARTRSDLYLDEKVMSWQSHVSHFNYSALISEEQDDNLASYVLSRNSMDLKEWQIVLSGPFDMVFNTRDALVSHGISSKHIFSDAFSFEEK